MSDKVIPFPAKEKEKMFAKCPECEGFNWEIEVDGPDVEKIHSFNCSTPECGYKIPLIMNITLRDTNDTIFDFSLDEMEDKIEFTLEDDDDDR